MALLASRYIWRVSGSQIKRIVYAGTLHTASCAGEVHKVGDKWLSYTPHGTPHERRVKLHYMAIVQHNGKCSAYFFGIRLLSFMPSLSVSSIKRSDETKFHCIGHLWIWIMPSLRSAGDARLYTIHVHHIAL